MAILPALDCPHPLSTVRVCAQIEVYGDATLQVGSEVEVKNIADGFENSWTAATITKKEKGSKFTVEFAGFVNEDGESESANDYDGDTDDDASDEGGVSEGDGPQLDQRLRRGQHRMARAR